MRPQAKVALVTAASAGIGRATAWMLAREGADVAINYLTYPEAAEELAGQVRALGRRALLCPVDVADQDAVDPDSDYVTGSTLTIDGGIQLPWWSKRQAGEF
jgi:NAD(P)-dependent dehydrogenase (short-subunit alcohol dehydrogenase family)